MAKWTVLCWGKSCQASKQKSRSENEIENQLMYFILSYLSVENKRKKRKKSNAPIYVTSGLPRISYRSESKPVILLLPDGDTETKMVSI